MWRTAERVFVQPLIGRRRRYGSVTKALDSQVMATMPCTYRYSNAGDLLSRGLRYPIESRTSLPVQPKKQRQIRRMSNEVRHFPARLMTPYEQALVADWLATAGDITLAYISKRSNDDPSLHRRIVIRAGTDDAPSHIVYAASGRDIWFVFEPGRRTKIRRFRTLSTALNSIRLYSRTQQVVHAANSPRN
jgi:hypothetical protein